MAVPWCLLQMPTSLQVPSVCKVTVLLSSVMTPCSYATPLLASSPRCTWAPQLSCFVGWSSKNPHIRRPPALSPSAASSTRNQMVGGVHKSSQARQPGKRGPGPPLSEAPKPPWGFTRPLVSWASFSVSKACLQPLKSKPLSHSVPSSPSTSWSDFSLLLLGKPTSCLCALFLVSTSHHNPKPPSFTLNMLSTRLGILFFSQQIRVLPKQNSFGFIVIKNPFTNLLDFVVLAVSSLPRKVI